MIGTVLESVDIVNLFTLTRGVGKKNSRSRAVFFAYVLSDQPTPRGLDVQNFFSRPLLTLMASWGP